MTWKKLSTKGRINRLESGKTYASKNWLIILGCVAGVLIVGSLILNNLVNNRIITAQEDGNDAGQIQGYSDGYEEGKTVGYDTGKEKGYNKGDAEGYKTGRPIGYGEGKEDGYNQGYAEGNKEGDEIGYAAGEEEGGNTGDREGYTAGKEEGYTNGYITGLEKVIGTDYLVRNPTYSEVLKILDQLKATSALQINNDCESEGIRTGYVRANIAEGSGRGVDSVAFETVDRGLIIIWPPTLEEWEPQVGKRVSWFLGTSSPDYDDTIVRITITW